MLEMSAYLSFKFFYKKHEHLKPTYLSKYLNMMKERIIQKKIDQIMTLKVKF